MNDAQTQTVIPGDGPGAEYVGKGWIWAIVSVFCLIALGLLISLVALWPDPEPRSMAEGSFVDRLLSGGSPLASDNSTADGATSGPATSDPSTSDPSTSDLTGSDPKKVKSNNGSAPIKDPAQQTKVTSPTDTGFKISRISPASSDPQGGTLALLAGSDFPNNVTVKFGETSATEVEVVGKDLIRVKVPPHPAGDVDVIVKGGDKMSDLPQGFAYKNNLKQRYILLLVLLAGALGGTLNSLISLSWFIGNRELKWSWVPYYVVHPLTGAALACIFFLTLVTGVWTDQTGKGQLWIIGLSALVGLFSKEGYARLKLIFEAVFTPAAKGADRVKTSGLVIDPNSGQVTGGNSVQITGSGFTTATMVKFDMLDATAVHVDSPTVLHAVVPPHAAGPVNVTVTNPGNPPEIRTVRYTYVSPAPPPAPKGGDKPKTPSDGVLGIDASSGPAAGGNSVRITGSGFTATTTVKFDTVDATSVRFVSPTSLQVGVPPHAPGQVDVTVTTPGASPDIKTVRYTYT